MDAAIYMREHKSEFDVIIVDSSDPVGPAETLYTSAFYSDMHAALRAGGVVCTQGECQWLHLDLIKRVMGDARALYPTVDYAYSCVPTYPNGQIGFIIAAKAGGSAGSLRAPHMPVPADMAKALRYYSAEAHEAAFVLPAFAAKTLEGVRAPQTAKASPLISVTTVFGVLAGVAAGAAIALLAGKRR